MAQKSRTRERDRRVVVAGASGYLGGYVVRALLREGWQVRSLVRDQSQASELERLGSDVFVGQATDPETLTGLFAGAEAAFSSIGIRHFKRRPTFEKVDYQANINLVEAAEAAGVERYVFVSMIDGANQRERSPLIDARERVVDRLRKSSVESVTLRPTGFFNDMTDYFNFAKKGRVWLIGSGETKLNPIHGADLADVAAEALAAAEPAIEIPVGGPDVFTQREIAELAFRILGRPVKCSSVSPGLVRFQAALIKPFNKNASALLKMFAMLGDRDAVAPRHGKHRLEDHFRELAIPE